MRGFKIAFGQPVHAAPEDADGAGDVAGEDVGQGEADQEDEAQNDDFRARFVPTAGRG